MTSMPPEERIGSHLKRAEQALLGAKNAAIKPAGVTVAQYAALLWLAEKPGISAAALSRLCGVTPPTMNTVLKNLQERGYIERSPHEWHRNVLETRLTAPRQRTLELARRLSGNPAIMADQVVARSEYQHAARNAAIAYLMKAYGNFENEVDKVLQSYFNACAIRMSCVDLARTFIYLANRGVPLGETTPLLPARTTKQVNALLATCGLYDEAGDFAYRVGMPGKSGVGGGIMALIPGELVVCVWSPELNKAGNSLAGTAALELLAERLGRSIF